jgi:hypothetical protein
VAVAEEMVEASSRGRGGTVRSRRRGPSARGPWGWWRLESGEDGDGRTGGDGGVAGREGTGGSGGGLQQSMRASPVGPPPAD